MTLLYLQHHTFPIPLPFASPASLIFYDNVVRNVDLQLIEFVNSHYDHRAAVYNGNGTTQFYYGHGILKTNIHRLLH
jgi:hypothetical protein